MTIWGDHSRTEGGNLGQRSRRVKNQDGSNRIEGRKRSIQTEGWDSLTKAKGQD